MANDIVAQALAGNIQLTQQFGSAFETGMKIGQAAKAAQMTNLIDQQKLILEQQKNNDLKNSYVKDAINNGFKLDPNARVNYFKASAATLSNLGFNVTEDFLNLIKTHPEEAKAYWEKVANMRAAAGANPVDQDVVTAKAMSEAYDVLGARNGMTYTDMVKAVTATNRASVAASGVSGFQAGVDVEDIKHRNAQIRDAQKHMAEIQASPVFKGQINSATVKDDNGVLGVKGAEVPLSVALAKSIRFSQDPNADMNQKMFAQNTLVSLDNIKNNFDTYQTNIKEKVPALISDLAKINVDVSESTKKERLSLIKEGYKLKGKSPEEVASWLEKARIAEANGSVEQRKESERESVRSLGRQENKEIRSADRAEYLEESKRASKEVATVKGVVANTYSELDLLLKAAKSNDVNTLKMVASRFAKVVGKDAANIAVPEAERYIPSSLRTNIISALQFITDDKGNINMPEGAAQRLVSILESSASTSKKQAVDQLNADLSSRLQNDTPAYKKLYGDNGSNTRLYESAIKSMGGTPVTEERRILKQKGLSPDTDVQGLLKQKAIDALKKRGVDSPQQYQIDGMLEQMRQAIKMKKASKK